MLTIATGAFISNGWLRNAHVAPVRWHHSHKNFLQQRVASSEALAKWHRSHRSFHQQWMASSVASAKRHYSHECLLELRVASSVARARGRHSHRSLQQLLTDTIAKEIFTIFGWHRVWQQRHLTHRRRGSSIIH